MSQPPLMNSGATRVIHSAKTIFVVWQFAIDGIFLVFFFFSVIQVFDAGRANRPWPSNPLP